jgi:hypothetical protein
LQGLSRRCGWDASVRQQLHVFDDLRLRPVLGDRPPSCAVAAALPIDEMAGLGLSLQVPLVSTIEGAGPNIAQPGVSARCGDRRPVPTPCSISA